MGKVVAAVVAGVAGLVGLLLGPGQFSVVVLVIAGWLVIDLAGLAGRAGARPVLPAAALAALGAPAAVVGADPAAGWQRLPVALAAAVLVGFTLVLVFGRRSGAVAGLGATLLTGLLVGAGASALLLLHALPAGRRLVLGLGLLVLAAEVATPLARWIDHLISRRSAIPLWGQEPEREDVRELRVVPAIVAVVVVAGLLLAFVGPPLGPVLGAGMGIVALVSVVGGQHVASSMTMDAGGEPVPQSVMPGSGAVFAATAAVIIGAPVTYVLARAFVP